ncbi:MAG: hypothetical protein QOF55_1755, partial [Thermoleophilaceae bacterium]|nr:hypothetical protein [Thermoleophilaceae bacterium]
EGPGSRLAGADPEAARAFERAALGWVEEAEQLGARGWRALDVVYSEQRVRRWGRHMLMRPGAPIVAPLAAPPVQRALAWLPLAERVSSGFHRRFLAERLPAIAVAEPQPLSRRRVPPALRRAVRAARGLRSAPSVPEPSMWEWGRHRVLHSWIADEVLTSPLLAEGLGGTWTAGLRERFLAGERDAEELARWAAGPVALAHALRELAEPVAGGSSAAGANRQDCTL